MKKHILLLLLLPFYVKSQVVSGSILSQKGDTVPFSLVNLKINNSPDPVSSTYSDDKGYFEFTLPDSSKSYYLEIISIGYFNHQTDSFAGPNQMGVIFLTKDVESIETVELFFNKKLIKSTGRGIEVNVSTSPLLENSNAKDILSKLPGVTVNQNGSLSLNGQQNVQVFFNGKPVLLSLDQLLQQLESTPGTEIDKIEVFNSPPARFDAEGTGGIINIITKHNNKKGFTGSVVLNGGIGRYPKYSGSTNFNFRKGKVNIYGSVNGFQNKFFYEQDLTLTTTINNDENIIYNERRPVFTVRNIHSKIGIDYTVDSNTTVGVMLSPYTGDFTGIESLFSTVIDGDYDYHSTNGYRDLTNKWNGNIYNFNVERKLEKGFINIDVDYLTNFNKSDQETYNDYILESTLIANENYQLKWLANIQAISGKVDFEKQLQKSLNLSAGAKISLLSMNNETDSKFINDTSELTLERNFLYSEKINALYFSVGKTWSEAWTADLGFRGEFTTIAGEFDIDSINFERNFLNIFPNASIRFSPNDKWAHSLTYSKRIRRPDYEELTPFEVRINPYLIHKGNPNLKPEINHQISYLLAIKEKYFVSINYSFLNGGIFITPQHEEGGIVQTYFTKNTGNQHNSSVTINTPFQLRKWWSINSNLTVYRNQLINAQELNFKIFSFNARVQNQFNFKKGWKAELIGFYNHKHYWNVWWSEPFFQFDASISKKINDWKFTITGSDIFGLRTHQSGQSQTIVTSLARFEPEKQIFKFALTYNFGNLALIKQRQRGTSSDELQERAK